MADRSFSHAIAEGDGISVIAAVEDADAARSAESQRAEALVMRGDPTAVREATSLRSSGAPTLPFERASAAADAVMLVFDALDDDDGQLEELHRRALALGLDCAVEVRDEEEVERALDRVDPEIFLLSAAEADDERTPLEVVLELLAAVPPASFAIADLPLITPEDVQELEYAGCDAVIVSARDLSPLVAARSPRSDRRQKRRYPVGMRRLWLGSWLLRRSSSWSPPQRRQPAAVRLPGRTAGSSSRPDPGTGVLPDLDAESARRQDHGPVHRHRLRDKDRSYLISFLEHGDLARVMSM